MKVTSRTLTFTVLAHYNAAPHKRYQPHPAEPAQHTTCSNTRLVLLKMDIMMPETCWESIDNKHLTVASCWFSLSLHTLLTMHGHGNLKLLNVYFWFRWSLLKIRHDFRVLPFHMQIRTEFIMSLSSYYRCRSTVFVWMNILSIEFKMWSLSSRSDDFIFVT